MKMADRHLNTSRAGGFSLLEVTIASTIMGLIILACLDFLAASSNFYSVDTNQTHLEWRLQYALDDIVSDLKETKPDRVEVFDFVDGPGGLNQTAIVFPTARNSNDQFIYTDGTGAVQAHPVWQGIAVYAFYSDKPGEPGFLCKYIDYSTTRNYETAITITAITATTITLSDGTTFNRALEGTSGNQFGLRLMSDFAQIVRNPAPPNPVSLPLRIKLVAQKRVDELQGDYVQAQSSTGVMARNKN